MCPGPATWSSLGGIFQVGLWGVLYFPLLGLRGSYLLIFFKSLKSSTQFFIFCKMGCWGLAFGRNKAQIVDTIPWVQSFRAQKEQKLRFLILSHGFRVQRFFAQKEQKFRAQIFDIMPTVDQVPVASRRSSTPNVSASLGSYQKNFR